MWRRKRKDVNRQVGIRSADGIARFRESGYKVARRSTMMVAAGAEQLRC
jgi:hypothetical protein